MRRRVLFFCMAAWVVNANATALEDAQRAWELRADPNQTERAIGLWQDALRDNPNQPEVYIAISNACGRAYRKATTKKEKQKWAMCGRDYGALSVQKNPENPVAYAEAAIGLGQWAQANRSMKSLSRVKEAVALLQKAIALKPDYAYAHMLLAEFYRQSPRMISIGNKKKAFFHAQKAVEYGPGYAINHLVLAQNYLERKEIDKARKELETVLALTPPSDAIPETKTDQETARKLLDKL